MQTRDTPEEEERLQEMSRQAKENYFKNIKPGYEEDARKKIDQRMKLYETMNAKYREAFIKYKQLGEK